MEGAAQQEELLGWQQQVQALIAAIHAGCEFRGDQGALVQQARQLMDLCQDDTLLELVVLEGGVDAAAALLDLSWDVDSSLAKAVKYACATLSTLAAKPQLKELLLDPRASQALPGLVRLLSPDVDADEPGVSRRAVEALTVLMRDSRDGQQLLRECGGVDCLVLLVGSDSIRTQRAAIIALHVLASGGKCESAQRYMVKCGALEGLVKVLCSCDVVMQHRALELVGLLVHNNKHSRHRALKAGAIVPLTQLLSTARDPDTQRAAALLVGQLAAPPLEEEALLAAADGMGDGFSVEHDTIPCLIDLLHPSHSSKGVQEMAAFALARLAQLRSHQAAIAQHGGLQALLMLLSSDNSNSSAGAQYNAAYALYELCEESEQALHLQQQGGLQQLHVSRERLQGQARSCIDSTILRIERHLAAAQSVGTAAAAGRGTSSNTPQLSSQPATTAQRNSGHSNSPRSRGDADNPARAAASAPAAAHAEKEEEHQREELSLTLTPLLRPATDSLSADTVESPLASTIFGGQGRRSSGVELSRGQQQDVQGQAALQSHPPLRLPSIDSVVGEAAAAAAAVAAATRVHEPSAHTRNMQSAPVPKEAVPHHQHQQTVCLQRGGDKNRQAMPAQVPLPSAAVDVVAELQQQAAAVEQHVQRLRHLAASAGSMVVQLFLLRLVDAVATPLEQQQQAATWLLQHSAGLDSPVAAVATLATAAAGNAHVVSSMLQLLAMELGCAQMGSTTSSPAAGDAAAAAAHSALSLLWPSTAGLVLQVCCSINRWSSSTQQLLTAVAARTPGAKAAAVQENSRVQGHGLIRVLGAVHEGASRFNTSLAALAVVGSLVCMLLWRHAGLVVSVVLGVPVLLLFTDNLDASKLEAALVDALAALVAVCTQQQHTESDTAASARAPIKRSVSFSIDGERPQQQQQQQQPGQQRVSQCSTSIWEAAVAAAEAQRQGAASATGSTAAATGGSSSSDSSTLTWINLLLVLVMVATTVTLLPTRGSSSSASQHTTHQEQQQAYLAHAGSGSSIPMHGAGQVVLGLALIGAAAAWLLQLFNRWLQAGTQSVNSAAAAAAAEGTSASTDKLVQQQQQDHTTTQQQLQLLLLQQQQLLLQHQQQQLVSAQPTESKKKQEQEQVQQQQQKQQQQPPVKPMLSSVKSVEGVAVTPAPPKHFSPPALPTSFSSSSSSALATSSNSSRDQQHQQQQKQPRWAAVVAAAERKEAARAASALTATALAKHSAGLNKSSKSYSASAPSAAGSTASSKAARSSRGDDTRSAGGGRDQDRQRTPFVCVQGRYASLPATDTADVEPWEAPLIVAVPPKRTASSSSGGSGSKGSVSNSKGGSASSSNKGVIGGRSSKGVTASSSSKDPRTSTASGTKSGPTTPRVTTPKAAAGSDTGRGSDSSSGSSSSRLLSKDTTAAAAAGGVRAPGPVAAPRVSGSGADMSGWEARGYPTVGLSGQTSPPAAARPAAAGCDNFTLKTFASRSNSGTGGAVAAACGNHHHHHQQQQQQQWCKSPVSPEDYPWQEPLRAPLPPQHRLEE